MLKWILLAALLYIPVSFMILIIPVKWNMAYGWAKGKFSEEEISHFPQKLPANSEIYFRRGFGQGGTDFQVLAHSNGSELDLDAHEDITIFAVDGSQRPPRNMPIPYIFAGNKQTKKIPDGTKLFILESRPYRDDSDGFGWNHGTTRGVAQNEEKRWVLYWYSVW